jgi:MIP family channel proteins
MRDRDWLKLAIVEFLGPFALVFAGVGAIVQTQGQNLVAVALAHGLAIGVMISALGHITGGVFNPAVTLGLLVARRIEARRALLYVVAQLLGAIAAAGLLTLVYPDLGALGRNNAGINLGVPSIGGGFSTTNALVMEIVLTFFLMLVIFGIGVDHRTSRTVTGLVIGLTITLDIFAGGAVSGAAMNPARAFGPALIQQDFADHWVWWVGPAIGAAIAALLYNDVLLRGTAPSDDETMSQHRPREAPDSIPVGQVEAVRSHRSRRSARRRR